ncbi:MAG: ABC transporter permease subunit [bacterium]|nr:MAG: ABC transporter permease subunit [bacterium]
MFSTLIEKELKSIILGPKFVATFVVCSVLILLSVFIGIQEYRAAVRSYEAGTQLVDQEMQEKSSWISMNSRVFRKPDPMQVFVSGVNNDIGRFSNIRSAESVKLTNSIYSDDPIFAAFRFIDLSFIVQVVLSLFAILFIYDAINGERERGTLGLTFSNAVPRFQYLLTKFLGSCLGLVVPILIPILVSFLLVIAFGIPLTENHWTRLIIFIGVSLLYFTFFIILGILISALTKRSAVSFLLLLVIWVTFVLIVPRVGVMAAGKIIPVPSVAEIDGQIEGFSKERWDKYMKDLEQRWETRNKAMAGMTKTEREAYRDNHMWDWMEENDALRKEVQADINEYSRTLHEDLRNRKAVQERLGFTLSRFSPVSAFQLSTMNLAGTDIHLKARYETALEQYHKTFVDYIEKKQQESGGGMGGIRISFSSETGFKYSFGPDKGNLDIGDMPRFQGIKHSISDLFVPIIIDIALLLFYNIAAAVGAFVAFLRYDVR